MFLAAVRITRFGQVSVLFCWQFRFGVPCNGPLLPIKDATLSGGTLQIHNFKGAGRDIQKYKMVPKE